jgi:NADH-quinone oxidoreductase subunit B
MGIEQKLGNMGIVTLKLEDVVNWSRTNAMWPMLFGLACCAIEMMATQASNYDLSRSMELMRDAVSLMIVAGRFSQMAPILRRLYDHARSQWVISMGTALLAVVSSTIMRSCRVDEIMPVDICCRLYNDQKRSHTAFIP